MKVIFIDDVPDVANAGETKEVADGYGRNYLLPRKLAVLANSAASNVVEAQLKKVAVKRAQLKAEMADMADKLKGTEITLKAKAGAQERLYGSVTSADIAEELSNSAGLIVDKRKIEMEEPIRQLGSHEVTVRFTHDIATTIKVTVVADEVAAEEPEAKKEKKTRAKKADEPAEAKVEETEEAVEEPEASLVETAEETEAEAEDIIEETEAKLEDAEAPAEAPEAEAEEAEEKEA